MPLSIHDLPEQTEENADIFSTFLLDTDQPYKMTISDINKITSKAGKPCYQQRGKLLRDYPDSKMEYYVHYSPSIHEHIARFNNLFRNWSMPRDGVTQGRLVDVFFKHEDRDGQKHNCVRDIVQWRYGDALKKYLEELTAAHPLYKFEIPLYLKSQAQPATKTQTLNDDIPF